MSAIFPIHRATLIKNFDYIKSRESLIPFAERVANVAAGISDKAGNLPDDIANVWNWSFHTEMERLVRQEGIVK